MIEDNSNVLIEQAIVIFQKKLRFKSRKKKKYRYIKLFAVLSKTKHETLN